jgi:shikimate kinase
MQGMSKLLGKRPRNLILVGMPGSGKSTFGKVYAAHTKRKFLDLDGLIERQARKTVAQLIQEEGIDAFRKLEHNHLQRLRKVQNAVISLGGGTPCSEEAYELVDSLGVVIWLKAGIPCLVERLTSKPQLRPLLTTWIQEDRLGEGLMLLEQERVPYYNRADFVLHTDFSSMDNLVLETLFTEKRIFSREYQNEVFKLTGEQSLYHRDLHSQKSQRHSPSPGFRSPHAKNPSHPAPSQDLSSTAYPEESHSARASPEGAATFLASSEAPEKNTTPHSHSRPRISPQPGGGGGGNRQGSTHAGDHRGPNPPRGPRPAAEGGAFKPRSPEATKGSHRPSDHPKTQPRHPHPKRENPNRAPSHSGPSQSRNGGGIIPKTTRDPASTQPAFRSLRAEPVQKQRPLESDSEAPTPFIPGPKVES